MSPVAPPLYTPRHMPHTQSLAFEKYLLLQYQHESLSDHLDQIRTSPTSFSPLSSSPSLYSSPLSGQSHSRLWGRSPSYHDEDSGVPEYTLSASAIMEDVDIAAEERRLLRVNESIKRALTELLNCEAVRNDGAFRTWVQSRLMATERELRSARRRVSASTLSPC